MFLPQPGACEHQGGRNVRYVLDRIDPIRQHLTCCATGAQPWTAADPVHLPLDLPAQPAVVIDGKHLELDA